MKYMRDNNEGDKLAKGDNIKGNVLIVNAI